VRNPYETTDVIGVYSQYKYCYIFWTIRALLRARLHTAHYSESGQIVLQLSRGRWGDDGVSLRLGIDFQSVREVDESLRLFGIKYLESAYDDGECVHALSHPHSAARYLAGRFAAREAVLKLLDAQDAVAMWRDILLSDDRRSTTVHLRGDAHLVAAELGIAEILLSVASTRELATAVAVADLRSNWDG
jgi:holo-[acyl-carrier protein] synthase